MDPWRVRQQGERVVNVCACVGRFGAENGPFHVLLCVLCGQLVTIVLVIDCNLR